MRDLAECELIVVAGGADVCYAGDPAPYGDQSGGWSFSDIATAAFLYWVIK